MMSKMKLSISNIGWPAEQDEQVYDLMKKYEYTGLEIAPTRIFPDSPYEKLDKAKIWSENLKKQNGFDIPSMQSIWYGRQEKIFGSDEERKTLIDYTKKAIDFASVIGCKNLVFGCPRNRNVLDNADTSVAVGFFRELGEYALERGTVIGMEANPPIYNTNYINDTLSALQLIKEVNSEGFLLNLDVGTMIQNNELVSELKCNVHLINHVHISEPGLKQVKERELHKELKQILMNENYTGFISIEIGNLESIENLSKIMQYVKEIYC